MADKIRKITLDNIHLSYKTYNGWKHVLKGINLSIPENKSFGVLGRNGAGKSTMVNIISGLLQPDKGHVDRGGLKISWPIGKPAFQGSISAKNNIKFICRVMTMDIKKTIEFVEDFAELGKYMDMPVSSFSSGMRSRLGFAVSMAADYDCILVDEGFSAGDANFKTKMHDLFEEKRKNKNMICISHNMNTIKSYCDYAGVLDKGELTIYEEIDEAIEIYKTL